MESKLSMYPVVAALGEPVTQAILYCALLHMIILEESVANKLQSIPFSPTNG